MSNHTETAGDQGRLWFTQVPMKHWPAPDAWTHRITGDRHETGFYIPDGRWVTHHSYGSEQEAANGLARLIECSTRFGEIGTGGLS
ncbi:hypothetical protein [Nocardia macrotermitis]|uniref:Uncharacterized protein n=1 Tax=Nocardia macrotermitis TaxID=2585198 RepID=A0A7K0DBK5_9NOCA|nr:hypothetical protein [Nocardia macrotermitis]MQY22682.1 hypothetical protein [Nocardia macrotermitis]